MFQFPINPKSVSTSLGGVGQLTLSTPDGAWKTLIQTAKPFSPSVSQVAAVDFQIQGAKQFAFGAPNGVQLGVTASASSTNQISLIWPGQSDPALADFGLDANFDASQLYARVSLSGKADGSARGTWPVGPLSATFGVAAGGALTYDRLKLYPKTEIAGRILGDLIGGVRLPQQLASVDSIPAAGEVLATRFYGYLKADAGVTWGYSLTGSRSTNIKDLSLDLQYALQIGGSVSASYQLADDLRIEALRGDADGWLRVVVKKDKSSEFNIKGDFGFTGTPTLNGLPSSADDFLTKLLGADVGTYLGYLQTAQTYSSLDQLQQLAGRLGQQTVQNLSQKWIGAALNNSTFQQFLGVAKRVVDEYRNIDSRILQFYSDYVGKLPELQALMTEFQKIESTAAFEKITNPATIEQIRKIWNERFPNLLVSDAEVAEFQKWFGLASDFLNGDPSKEIRDLISVLKQDFPLDSLLNQLAQFDTPEKLQALADTKLQGLVERIVGKTFEEIQKTEVSKIFEQVNQTITKIENFKRAWYQKLTEVFQKTYTFDLVAAYTRADQDTALIDIQVNLAAAAGPAIAREATAGDFTRALRTYDPAVVKIANGLLTHNLTKTGLINVNLFGWTSDRFVELVQNTEEALQPQAGGLLHVFTTSTSIDQKITKGGRNKETAASKFLLRTVADRFQQTGATDSKTNEYIVQTLNSLSVDYTLDEAQDVADAADLRNDLDLAQFLGLLASADAMAATLRQQFPGGLGEVTVSYVVRYDDSAVRDAFSLSNSAVETTARQTMRKFISTKYQNLPVTAQIRPLGAAYASAEVYALYQKGFTALRDANIAVKAKGSASQALSPALKASLITLFNIEQSYVRRLRELNGTIQSLAAGKGSVSLDDLNSDAERFVSMADDMDRYRENAFFAVFDKLVRAGGGASKSSMILTITPPGGQAVTKILSSAAANS